MGIIYLARCKENEKGYVGQTVNFKRRIKGHKVDAENGSTNIFHRAIRKYGWDSFEWTILYEDDDNDLDWMGWWERKFIRELRTKTPNGYNMSDGGEGTYGLKWKDESRQKLSNTKKITPTRWYGVRTEESKKKISEALMGHPVSEDTREKLRQQERSPETKKKLSESAKKRMSEMTVEEKSQWMARARSGKIGKVYVVSLETRKKQSEAAKLRAARMTEEEKRLWLLKVKKGRK